MWLVYKSYGQQGVFKVALFDGLIFIYQTDRVGYASKHVFLKFIDFELYELYCASYLCRGIGQTSCSFEHVSFLHLFLITAIYDLPYFYVIVIVFIVDRYCNLFLTWLLGISTVTEIWISADILENQYNVKYCLTGKRAILLCTVMVISVLLTHLFAIKAHSKVVKKSLYV